ncbi:MAG TPA: hypothetical protein VGB26_10905 [Nitrospiria bacterium]
MEIRQLPKLTVCTMAGRTVFEIHHQSGDSFRTNAELYTPDGCFVKAKDAPSPELVDASGNALRVGGITMSDCTFQNLRIGVWLRSDGSCSLGVG